MDHEQPASHRDPFGDVLAEEGMRSRRSLDEATGPQGDGEMQQTKPKLLFVYGEKDGPSRRIDGFLAQVLQRRRNHETFELVRVCAESHPALVERLGVSSVPTIIVVEGRAVQARVEVPKGRREIEAALAPWLH